MMTELIPGARFFVDPGQRGDIVTGDRVIAKINGENLVNFKQLAHNGAKLNLKPLNQHHSPIFQAFRVLGKVIGMWVPE